MRTNDPDDDQLGRALAGDGPVPPGLEPVALAASRLRRALTEPTPAALADRCVAAAAETARLVHDKGDPAAMPASKARRSPREMSGLPKWRERTMISNTILSTLAGRLAVGGASAVLALGSAATVGALPAPLQSMASDVASGLGVTIPDPRHQVEVEDRDVVDDRGVDPSEQASEAAAGDDDRSEEPSEAAEIRGADEPGEVETEHGIEIEDEHHGGDDGLSGSDSSGPSGSSGPGDGTSGSTDTSGSGSSGSGSSGSDGSGSDGSGSGSSGDGSGSSGSSGPGSGSVSPSPTPSPTSSSGSSGRSGSGGSDND